MQHRAQLKPIFTTAFTILKTEVAIMICLQYQNSFWWGYERRADDKEILVLILLG